MNEQQGIISASDIRDRLETLQSQINVMSENSEAILSTVNEINAKVNPTVIGGEQSEEEFPPPEMVSKEAVRMPTPVEVSITWLGLHEVRDNTEIRERFGNLGINGPDYDEPLDPVRTSWCAAAISAWLLEAGYDIEVILTARDFFDLPFRHITDREPRPNDLAVLSGHVALVAGYGPVREKIIFDDDFKSHIKPEKTDDNDVLWIIGCNQSNECNASPLEWYTRTAEFLGFVSLDDVPFRATTGEGSAA